MLKKYINEKTLRNIPRNGSIKVNGVVKCVSNLETYLLNNKEIANENGFYDYVQEEAPFCQENQCLEKLYKLENNIIYCVWNVIDMEIQEENEVTE